MISKTQVRRHLSTWTGVLILALAGTCAFAQANATTTNPCPRAAAGSVATNLPSLFSKNGVLTVNFSFNTTTDANGRALYCFTTPDGLENPTLHVSPGDKLVVNVKNNTPAATTPMEVINSVCGSPTMYASSVNVHYHGTNTSPGCGADDVIHTLINSGQTFTYTLKFPFDEPPGLYWYHPHVHGIAEGAVLGGAHGAIVVEGIQNLQPQVAGLRQRILQIGDQTVATKLAPGGRVPSWDLTLNTIPIAYPTFKPAVIQMLPGEKQLWRVANEAADSLVDLQVIYDGVPQPLQIVALDGVPTGSNDGTLTGSTVSVTHYLVPTAGRVEFIVAAPAASVKSAIFKTLAVGTGPAGDNDTDRALATIQLVPSIQASSADEFVPAVTGLPGPQRFQALDVTAPTAERKLYFSEVISDPTNPLSPTNFFITVDGATPTLFDANNPPAIVTTQGSVEDWTIENRATENHEFHFHQIHFLVLSQDNFPINGTTPDPTVIGQYLDMIQLPYWDGNPAHPYPSVRVRMDFRGPDIGDFVYHCHILGHEDNGMMAIIRVLPRP